MAMGGFASGSLGSQGGGDGQGGMTLARGLSDLGLNLSGEQITQLLEYLRLIQKWNKVYNLTAVRNPDEMLTHHLLDSLSVIAPLRRHLAER